MKRLSLKQTLSAAVVGLALLASPKTSLAQEEDTSDARLRGYSQDIKVGNDSTAIPYMILLVAGALTVGVMFKNAKRTHLD